MKEKTIDKLQRKIESLSKHHIDTCIFLESESKDETQQCMKYLQKAGIYDYRCVISLSVLSELMSIITRIDDYNKREDFLEIMIKTLKEHRIEQHFPENIEEIMVEIKKIDNRLESMDRQILACAIEDKANTLVTLDTKLVNNEKLEKHMKLSGTPPIADGWYLFNAILLPDA